MNKVIAPIIYGDRTQTVSDLQNALIKLGFAPISADEIKQQLFGDTTCNALKSLKDKFQIQSFPCLIENQTRDKLNQRLAQKGLPAKIVAPLFFGMKIPAVRDLQEALTNFGFGGIDPNKPGEFEKTTCQSVLKFQKESGLNINACYVDNIIADKINSLIDGVEKFTVSGRVLSSAGQSIIGVTVIAYDNDHLQALPLGSAVTNVDGFYQISYNPAQFATEGKNKVDLIIQAFDTAGRKLITSNVIIAANLLSEEKIDLLVQDNVNSKKYSVSGRVLNQFGEGIGSKTVMAYDVDLNGARIYKTAEKVDELNTNGGMQFLGGTTSNADGFYSITFTQDQFSTAEVGLADVVSYVTQPDPDGIMMITGRSAMTKDSDYKNGLSVENLDIVINDSVIRGLSEYDKIISVVNPFMEANQLTLFQIADSPDQIVFLSTELQQDLNTISILVNASSLNNDMLGNERWQEFIYGLGRQSVKLDWSTISRISIETITADILQSVSSNIISAGTNPREETKAVVSNFAVELHSFAVQKSLDQSAAKPNGVKNILKVSIKDDTLMHSFYQSYINRKGTPNDFWDSLRKDDTMKDHVDTLLMTNRLSALTGNNANVIQRLISIITDNDITKLLEISNDDWNNSIGNDVPENVSGINDIEKQNNYRKFMQGMLFAAYPNEKVALMIKNDLTIDDPAVRDLLFQFMTSTKFDLKLNRLHDKMDPNKDATFQNKLEEISRDRTPDVLNELNKIQRVFQFSPSPELMIKLLDNGIDSATMVSSMPYITFKSKYQALADEQTLLSIHQRASHIVSMIEYTMLSLNRFAQSAKISAITGQNNS